MKMTFILASALLLVPTLTKARLPTTAACDNSEIEQIQSYAANIQSRMNYLDVSSQIDKLNQSLNRCNISPKIFGGNDKSLEKWKNIGLTNELKTYEKRIVHFSEYRNVDEELKRYNQLASSLGVSPAKIKVFTNIYRSQGINSEDKERANCKEIPQIKSAGLGPVRQQDTMGWCYAFAAADLLGHKLGRRISAADIATQYIPDFVRKISKKNFGLSEHELQRGGWARLALLNLKLKSGGACPESKFTSEEDNGYAAIYSILENIEKLRASGNASIDFSQCIAPLKALFPQLKNKDILAILQRGAETQLFSLLDNKACGPRINLDHLSFRALIPDIYPFKKKEIVMSKIDEQLMKRNPVSIMYNGNILSERYPWTHSSHESLLIGRKFNEKSGECEYLVRNSYGRDCGNHYYTFKCTEGNLWIPKSVILQGKGIEYATYIE